MEGRARPGSRPLHRPPPPSASFVRRLRAGGVGAVALLAWAVAAPGFLPGDALAAGARPPVVAGVARGSGPSAAEEARLRTLAWQRGREAAAAAERDQAAVRQAAAGAGATATPAGWVAPPGGPALPPPPPRAPPAGPGRAAGVGPGRPP